MSVDTEKPTVQSPSGENGAGQNHQNTNGHHDHSKTAAALSKKPTTTNTSSPPRMTTPTATTTAASSSPPRQQQQQQPQQPRAQTPPIPPKSSQPVYHDSPRASYFRQIREQQQRAMEKFFETTIDRPCYAIEEQLEYITRCQQPPAFWNMFHHDSHESNDSAADGVVPMGMYVVPVYCEYCGASNTRLCPSSCQRPKLFFRKKRPPFCNQLSQWDDQTEYSKPIMARPVSPKWDVESEKAASRKTTSSPNWVNGISGMFHHHDAEVS